MLAIMIVMVQRMKDVLVSVEVHDHAANQKEHVLKVRKVAAAACGEIALVKLARPPSSAMERIMIATEFLIMDSGWVMNAVDAENAARILLEPRLMKA
jgi:hypothetical protein